MFIPPWCVSLSSSFDSHTPKRHTAGIESPRRFSCTEPQKCYLRRCCRLLSHCPTRSASQLAIQPAMMSHFKWIAYSQMPLFVWTSLLSFLWWSLSLPPQPCQCLSHTDSTVSFPKKRGISGVERICGWFLACGPAFLLNRHGTAAIMMRSLGSVCTSKVREKARGASHLVRCSGYPVWRVSISWTGSSKHPTLDKVIGGYDTLTSTA